jgi:hypothetical protein
MQFQDFTAAWAKYLEEYDRMAQMYIQQMTERHAVALLELQQRLQRYVVGCTDACADLLSTLLQLRL